MRAFFILYGVFCLGCAFQEIITGTSWDKPDGGMRSLLAAAVCVILAFAMGGLQ